MSSAVRTLFLRRHRLQQEETKREFRPQSGSESSIGRVQVPSRPRRPRYRVDLSSQQADCEANYLRLRKVLPALHERDEWLFELGVGEIQRQMYINVVDRAPYTTTLQITQPWERTLLQEPGSAAAACLRAPALTVCMYHDADMAEVVGWENHRRLQPRYDYPNPRMYHSDEKAQLNRFLADWLTLCQAEGRVVFDLAELGLYK